MEPLTIGTLAKAAQVNLQTIRYYEREGLLPEAPRRPSGYRMFSSDSVRRLRFIKRAQELGFSLAEIAEIKELALRPDVKTSYAEVRAPAGGPDSQTAFERAKKALERLTPPCTGRSRERVLKS